MHTCLVKYKIFRSSRNITGALADKFLFHDNCACDGWIHSSLSMEFCILLFIDKSHGNTEPTEYFVTFIDGDD